MDKFLIFFVAVIIPIGAIFYFMYGPIFKLYGWDKLSKSEQKKLKDKAKGLK